MSPGAARAGLICRPQPRGALCAPQIRAVLAIPPSLPAPLRPYNSPQILPCLCRARRRGRALSHPRSPSHSSVPSVRAAPREEPGGAGGDRAPPSGPGRGFSPGRGFLRAAPGDVRAARGALRVSGSAVPGRAPRADGRTDGRARSPPGVPPRPRDSARPGPRPLSPPREPRGLCRHRAGCH